MPGDSFDLFYNKTTNTGAYPFALSISAPAGIPSTHQLFRLSLFVTSFPSLDSFAHSLHLLFFPLSSCNLFTNTPLLYSPPRLPPTSYIFTDGLKESEYEALEQKLALPDGLKQYFDTLWSEGFTSTELLVDISADDLKELSIL